MTLALEDIEAWAAAGEAATRLEAAAGDVSWMSTLARAMARDAALLRRRPDLTLPCVTRLVGHDPALAPLLADWRRAWRAARRGRWLRALTPPMVSVNGPLLAEFVDGAGDVRLPEVIAPTPRFELTRERTWGVLACVEFATGTTWSTPVDDDSSFTTLSALDDDDVVAGGWWGDYGGVLARATPRTGVVRWRIELPHAVETIAIAASAQRAFVHDGRHGYLVDLTDGAVLGWTALVDAAVTLTEDAMRLITRRNGVRRLWDVVGLIDDDSPAPRRGFVAAAFDRDGVLLLQGAALHDARSGALLATLEVDGPNYIEGGPPERGRRVIPDGFVEARPFGLRRWNATGAIVVDDEGRRFGLSDLVVFAPDGVRMVFRTRRTEHLTVARTDDGFELARSATPTNDAVEWSPHGRAIAYVSTAGEVRLLRLASDERWEERVIGDCPGAIALAWSIDGDLLAAAQPGKAKLWNVTAAPTLVGDLALMPGGPAVLGDALHGELGFIAQRHPWRCRWHAGVATIEDRRTGEAVAAIRSDHPLVPDVTGTRWAAADGLFALEGDD